MNSRLPALAQRHHRIHQVATRRLRQQHRHRGPVKAERERAEQPEQDAQAGEPARARDAGRRCCHRRRSASPRLARARVRAGHSAPIGARAARRRSPNAASAAVASASSSVTAVLPACMPLNGWPTCGISNGSRAAARTMRPSASTRQLAARCGVLVIDAISANTATQPSSAITINRRRRPACPGCAGRVGADLQRVAQARVEHRIAQQGRQAPSRWARCGRARCCSGPAGVATRFLRAPR